MAKVTPELPSWGAIFYAIADIVLVAVIVAFVAFVAYRAATGPVRGKTTCVPTSTVERDKSGTGWRIYECSDGKDFLVKERENATER